MRTTNNSTYSEDPAFIETIFKDRSDPEPAAQENDTKPVTKKKKKQMNPRWAPSSEPNSPPCPSCLDATSKTGQEVVCRGPAPCGKCRKAKKSKQDCLAAVPGSSGIRDNLLKEIGDQDGDDEHGGEDSRRVINGAEKTHREHGAPTNIEEGKMEYNEGEKDDTGGKKTTTKKSRTPASASVSNSMKPENDPRCSRCETLGVTCRGEPLCIRCRMGGRTAKQCHDPVFDETEPKMGSGARKGGETKRVYDKAKDGKRTTQNGGFDGGYWGEGGIRYD